MKIFKSDSALGYMEFAYFIKINEEEYLCIFENSSADNFWKPYKVGELAEFDFVEELEEIDESKHEMILKESPIYGTFLFNEFMKNLK